MHAIRNAPSLCRPHRARESKRRRASRGVSPFRQLLVLTANFWFDRDQDTGPSGAYIFLYFKKGLLLVYHTGTMLVPARRSRAGASDSDRGGVDEVSPDINSVYLYPSRNY